jgi:hypothetical protein
MSKHMLQSFGRDQCIYTGIKDQILTNWREGKGDYQALDLLPYEAEGVMCGVHAKEYWNLIPRNKP